jgi:hypothetical protein
LAVLADVEAVREIIRCADEAGPDEMNAFAQALSTCPSRP